MPNALFISSFLSIIVTLINHTYCVRVPQRTTKVSISGNPSFNLGPSLPARFAEQQRRSTIKSNGNASNQKPLQRPNQKDPPAFHRECTIGKLYRDDNDNISNKSEPEAQSPFLDLEVNDTSTVKNSGQSLKTLSLVGLTSLALVSGAAQLGLISASSTGDAYTADVILRDDAATVLAVVLAGVFVKLCTSQGSWLSPRDSRKIVHTFAAPLFVLVWPLFSNGEGARFFAAIVALLNGVKLYIAGTGKGGDESELARAVSRSGDAKEALQGPFVYVIVLFTAVLAWWRNSLVGIVAISTMAAGDGMADLIGRRFGANNKWSFSPDKSVAGTVAFIIASTITSIGLALW
eukprot:CAMPEP_0172506290 /NCGR_PEP_ID=MMETSP1066-20121228/193646_1 /TAXON_ID=671091 /ORGANISM="Coscinodiscus wailesii, Strain CCMP2513" /LENGTH=347 /DNA_ID=CAMNT_0013283259 /DNA_START=38 /DNA_END=1078 /DNA_ORIENTATION=-